MWSCEKDELDEQLIEDVIEEIEWSPIQFVDVDPSLSPQLRDLKNKLMLWSLIMYQQTIMV